MIVDAEPVHVAAAVRSVLVVVCLLGPWKLDDAALAAVVVAVEAVLALLVRSKVTPKAKS